MAGDPAQPTGDLMVAGPGRRRPRRLAPGRPASTPRLPATACAPDRLVRQSRVGNVKSQAQYLAGGTTQLDLMLKDGVIAPDRLGEITRLALRDARARG